MENAKKSTPNDLVALSTDTGTNGLISYWRLGGACSAEQLEAHVDGLVKTPNPAGPVTALKRAVEAVAGPRDIVRRHPKTGYILIEEEVTEDGEHLRHSEGLHVWWEGTAKEGNLVFNRPHNPLCARVRDSFWYHRTHITSTELSAWLPRVACDEFDAVSLRHGGGVYYVPANCVDAWQQLTGIVSGLTDAKFRAIPALTTDDAVEAILDAVVAESQRLVAEMERDMERDNIGKRALDTHQARCEAFRYKMQRYERALGLKLDSVRESIDDMTVAIVEKMTVLDGGE